MSLDEDRVRCVAVGDQGVAGLLDQMGRTAYQGRTLAEAVDIWREMLRQPNLTIVLGLAGSMSTAGQWGLISWLIERRFVDVLVSTGANVSEDIVDGMGPGYLQGNPREDDAALLERDLNRYYDVYGRETDYRAMEDLLVEYLLTVDARAPTTSTRLMHGLGQFLQRASIPSIATAAARHGVPVFVPAMTDSAFGEAFLLAANRGHRLVVDQVREFDELVGIGKRTGDVAVIYIGGGVPKDFAQLMAISLSPQNADRPVRGRKGIERKSLKEFAYPHRYAVQITTDSPQWGGLSGCTLDEAVSWGKVDAVGRHVTCHCDATIALPLICQALHETADERPTTPNFSWLLEGGGRATGPVGGQHP